MLRGSYLLPRFRKPKRWREAGSPERGPVNQLCSAYRRWRHKSGDIGGLVSAQILLLCFSTILH